MRRITTVTKVGKVNMPAPFSKEFALLVMLLAAVLWVGYAFAQEVLLNHGLNAQAADLRQQNATIAAQNQAYRRDLVASSAGAAADEDARAHGYARGDERIYVVGKPALADSKSGTVKVSIGGQSSGPWQSLGRWIANFFHR